MIRERGESDLDSCAGFLRDVHELAGYPVNWPADPQAWLTPPGILGAWVITTDDGRVAGHVAPQSIGVRPVSRQPANQG
ncbi:MULTISPECIES: hypothetical protein [unclassified Kribbella]|uniref:hypothetical protein n=1 Tax=unclassified Kribbella TaxID=2644121 RepID=UPI0030167853